MQRLEVSCAVRPLYGSLGVKGLNYSVPAGILIGNRNGMKHLVELGVDGDDSKTSIKEIVFEGVEWVQLCGD